MSLRILGVWCEHKEESGKEAGVGGVQDGCVRILKCSKIKEEKQNGETGLCWVQNSENYRDSIKGTASK